nr:MAG TPA: hypothetical protein [Bacteriophage sp.]
MHHGYYFRSERYGCIAPTVELRHPSCQRTTLH